MSIVIGVLLLFIAGLFIWRSNFFRVPTVSNQPGQAGNKAATTSATAIEAGKKATENLVNSLEQNAAESGSPAKIVTINRIVDGKEVAEQAVSAAKGTSPISVVTGEVIAATGETAQNSVAQSPSSPTESFPVDPGQLPAGSIKLTLNSDNTIVPNSFTVHPGQAVLLAVTNKTSLSEVILFDDPSLAAIGFSLLPNLTRVMTFNAPIKTGEYVFASDIPVQRSAGMIGKMIVK